MLNLIYEADAAAWRMPLSRQELHALFKAMQKATGLEDYSVELTLSNDAHIAQVNAAYLGCEGPTNILSFPALAMPKEIDSLNPLVGLACLEPSDSYHGESPLLGTLLLSIDTLLREAFLYGQDQREHCIRLLAHGLGHIAGYDHSPEMDDFEAEARNAFSASYEG